MSHEKLGLVMGGCPSRQTNLASPMVYKTPLHGVCYPPWVGVLCLVRRAFNLSRWQHRFKLLERQDYELSFRTK